MIQLVNSRFLISHSEPASSIANLQVEHVLNMFSTMNLQFEHVFNSEPNYKCNSRVQQSVIT